jgi:5-methylcytosine-specific restriction enzyme A
MGRFCEKCAPLVYDPEPHPEGRRAEALEALTWALERLESEADEEGRPLAEAFTTAVDHLWTHRPEEVLPRRRPVSRRIRKLVLERDEYACVECGSSKELQIDHAIPVHSGGPNCIENLRTLCATCNLEKKAL